MKKTLLLFACILASVHVGSQSFSTGLLFGHSIPMSDVRAASDLDYSLPIDYQEKVSLCDTLGIYLSFPINDSNQWNLFLQPEVMYRQLTNIAVLDEIPGDQFDARTLYFSSIDVLQLNLSSWLRIPTGRFQPIIGFGPSISLVLSAEQGYIQSNISDSITSEMHHIITGTQDFAPFDYGFNISLGLEITSSLTFDARYYYGIPNIKLDDIHFEEFPYQRIRSISFIASISP